MTTWLVVLGSIAAYLTVGLWYARSRSVAVYRKASRQWTSEDIRREAVTIMLLWRVVFFPYAMVFDACSGGIRSWLMSPLTEQRKRSEQLREDARVWQGKQFDPTLSQAERDLAGEMYLFLMERVDAESL